MTQWGQVRISLLALALAVPVATNAAQSGPDGDLRVYTDAPRLFLTPARLRLLQRERDRKSPRWEQFDLLITGGAKMPEPGFAGALYYRISRDAGVGRRAVEWALTDASEDLRQLALVFDWCGPVMTPAQADRLGAKIERALAEPPPGRGSNPGGEIARMSTRVLAAIAIADRFQDHGEALLKPMIEEWRDVAKRAEAGDPAIPRTDVYALFEMLHAIRDNLKSDLRENARAYFRELPMDHLASHYPASFRAPENDYRVPVFIRDGDPDATEAALSRAAELAMVAFDSNDGGNQYLQGWLMQDRFTMRGALGAPYEFLWANPYQPGLSYAQSPLVYHNPVNGHLFARASWDEDAAWVGYFDGHLQLFRDGRIVVLRSGAMLDAVRVGDASILSVANSDAAKFHVVAGQTFVLGLARQAAYDVEIDDEELAEAETDNGGTLVLALPEGADAGVRVRKRQLEPGGRSLVQ
ncbi:MAG TPA: hypothetical protein VGR73_21130 [Bryobacteraceae bacterium]|nr:hypothetical protein [Bryobacteraceae bacterium]